MANQPITMSKIKQVLRFHTEGVSKLSNSEQTGVARNTVKKYIRWFTEQKLTFDAVNVLTDMELEAMFVKDQKPEIPQRLELLRAFFPYMEKKLLKVGQNREKLWLEYQKKHPDGYLITQFCHHYKEWSRKVNPSMHMEHKAGDKLFIDFAGAKLQVVDKKTGEIKDAEVFLSILGASQLTYIEAVESQRKEDFISACENALHFYGGVPAALVPDNLKSAVTKVSRYEPTLNESFLSFAEHYQTYIVPARAYRPKDKSHVENVVKIIYGRAYAALSEGELFGSLEELNAALWAALEAHNNTLLTGRDYSRRQQFEEIEKEVLKPLPLTRFEFKKHRFLTVTKFGDVCLSEDKHYYSVPYKYIGFKIKLTYSKSEVTIYYNHDLIANHKRNMRPYRYTSNPDHMASAHKYMTEWTPERFISWAETIGEDVMLYVKGILETPQHPEQGYRSCLGILRLQKKVGSQRLNNACKRAQCYGVNSYGIINNILEKGMDSIAVPDTDTQKEMPDHENIRGENYFK